MAGQATLLECAMQVGCGCASVVDTYICCEHAFTRTRSLIMSLIVAALILVQQTCFDFLLFD